MIKIYKNDDLPLKNGDVPVRFVQSPEGTNDMDRGSAQRKHATRLMEVTFTCHLEVRNSTFSTVQKVI